MNSMEYNSLEFLPVRWRFVDNTILNIVHCNHFNYSYCMRLVPRVQWLALTLVLYTLPWLRWLWIQTKIRVKSKFTLWFHMPIFFLMEQIRRLLSCATFLLLFTLSMFMQYFDIFHIFFKFLPRSHLMAAISIRCGKNSVTLNINHLTCHSEYRRQFTEVITLKSIVLRFVSFAW